MNRGQRIRAVIDALEKIAAGDADWAVFEDGDIPDNYVQVGDFGQGRTAYVEVTSRDWGGPLPRLNEAQLQALETLGFDRTPSPNHAGFYDWPQAGCIARLVESAFMILGSSQHFDLKVERMGFWAARSGTGGVDEIRDASLRAWMDRTGRSGPHPASCTQSPSPRTG